MDYRNPEIRRKARTAAVMLGEPAATEVRALLDALDTADAEAKQASALRAALLEVYRVLSGEEPADDALAALAEYTVDEARHVKRLLAEARADLAEARLRLAIWSGEDVPEGWEAGADGKPYLVRHDGDRAITIDPQRDALGGYAWAGWWRLGDWERYEECEYQRTATATEALAAAEAWLAGVAP